MSDEKITIKPKPLCYPCRYKLMHKAKFKQTDPWMALEIMATMVLVQNALVDKKYLIKYGNDVEGINRIECLSCFLPDMMKKIIEAAKGKDLEKVKALGELKSE